MRNLGVIELYARHASDYLAQQMIDNLNEYGLGVNQIYCCTTDNGANMLKMTQLLQQRLNESFTNHTIDVNDIDTNDSDEEEDEYGIEPETFQDDLDTALSLSLQI